MLSIRRRSWGPRWWIKCSALLLVAFVALAAPAPARWSSAEGAKGDVDCSGLVTSIDAVLILQLDAALVDSLSCQSLADVSGDGAATAIDAALILQFTAGLLDMLPAQEGPPPVSGEPTVTPSGLQIFDVQVGAGTEVHPGAVITVHYTGWLDSGKMIVSSYVRGQPAVFSLNAVILGWKEGVVGMRVGGMRRLIIPPELAYGEDGRIDIPPNAVLIFDIELLDVENTS